MLFGIYYNEKIFNLVNILYYLIKHSFHLVYTVQGMHVLHIWNAFRRHLSMYFGYTLYGNLYISFEIFFRITRVHIEVLYLVYVMQDMFYLYRIHLQCNLICTFYNILYGKIYISFTQYTFEIRFNIYFLEYTMRNNTFLACVKYVHNIFDLEYSI